MRGKSPVKTKLEKHAVPMHAEEEREAPLCARKLSDSLTPIENASAMRLEKPMRRMLCLGDSLAIPPATITKDVIKPSNAPRRDGRMYVFRRGEQPRMMTRMRLLPLLGREKKKRKRKGERDMEFADLEECLPGDIVVDDDRGVAMRQVPFRRAPWSCTHWISEYGEMRRLHYDVVLRAWRWGDVRLATVDRSGRSGYIVDGSFLPVDRAIALAWVPRKRGDRVGGTVCKEGNDVVAHNLAWELEEEEEGGEAGEEEGVFDDEVWRTLDCHIGLVRCRTRYKVSSLGRLKDSKGRLVQPFTRAYGRSFLSIERVGLIPIDAVSELMFGKHEARKPPPRILKVISSLEDGSTTVRDIASTVGVAESTAWSYVWEALRSLPQQKAEDATRRLVGARVVTCVRKIAGESPVVLSCRLRDAVHMVDRCFAAVPNWRTDAHRYARVRVVRDMLRRERA